MIERLTRAVEAEALIVLGGFRIAPEDGFPPRARTAVVIANAGPALWRAIGAEVLAAEARGEPDPIDAWTRARLGAIARAFEAEAFFPFGGPPHWPFLRWAQRAEPRLARSPLGLSIHPEHGLWLGLRGALSFEAEFEIGPERAPEPSPCESCIDRPCLSACPVGAFAPAGYDVEGCAEHLAGADRAGCMEAGCAARRACPVGAPLDPVQAAYHMRAFARSRRERPSPTPRA